ncbi:MAG: hypothetical protein OXF75_03820 [Acidimicrobiaceae bacterium]|nr:hypothetical protein [Acidimicrobiaceae bacterium]
MVDSVEPVHGDDAIEEPLKPSAPNQDESVENLLDDPDEDLPEENLLEEAGAWLETQELPDEGVPQGFIAIDRLLGECVRSFGIEVLEPEAAYRSGVYYFRSGDQLERVTLINAACENALSDRGVILNADSAAFTIVYESYVEVHSCLIENGFPTTYPPTLDAFIDSPHAWTPWKEMIGNSSPIFLESPPADGPLTTYYESLLICPRP